MVHAGKRSNSWMCPSTISSNAGRRRRRAVRFAVQNTRSDSASADNKPKLAANRLANGLREGRVYSAEWYPGFRLAK